ALDAAAARGLALLRAAPERRNELDGLGRSLAQALAALGERRVERDDYAHAADEARALANALASDGVQAAPQELGATWNNLGFLLRELATQVASGAVPAADREQRAREVFRDSWQAYERAVELLPGDARVANDAALIQVYHLRDNLAAAEG